MLGIRRKLLKETTSFSVSGPFLHPGFGPTPFQFTSGFCDQQLQKIFLLVLLPSSVDFVHANG